MANIFDFMDDYRQMNADASRIIRKRVTMMLTGTMSGDEFVEMIAEKVTAVQDSITRGANASVTCDPLEVATAMLVPFRKKTSINVERLSC